MTNRRAGGKKAGCASGFLSGGLHGVTMSGIRTTWLILLGSASILVALSIDPSDGPFGHNAAEVFLPLAFIAGTAGVIVMIVDVATAQTAAGPPKRPVGRTAQGATPPGKQEVGDAARPDHDEPPR